MAAGTGVGREVGEDAGPWEFGGVDATIEGVATQVVGRLSTATPTMESTTIAAIMATGLRMAFMWTSLQGRRRHAGG